MPVNLSIKNVPDELAARLKLEAANNHRSLNGQVIEMLKAQVATAERKDNGVQTLMERVRALGIKSSESSVSLIRQMRDER
jgi:antitoxin FitA